MSEAGGRGEREEEEEGVLSARRDLEGRSWREEALWSWL
jgi:hypothetical protein